MLAAGNVLEPAHRRLHYPPLFPGGPRMSHVRTILSPAQLESVTDLVEEFHDPLGWDHPPLLIGITEFDGDEVTTEVKALVDVDDPVESLIGLVAPDHWLAFGLLALGKAYGPGDARWARYVASDPKFAGLHTDAGPLSVDVHNPEAGHTGQAEKPEWSEPSIVPGRVRTLSVVGRCGRMSSVVRNAHGPRLVTPATVELATGRIEDYSRRVLGLPTARPAQDVRALWSARWLNDVCSAVTPATHRVRGHAVVDANELSWLDVLRYHRYLGLLFDNEPSQFIRGGSVISDDEISVLAWRLGNIGGRREPWSQLQHMVATRSDRWFGRSPTDALWFDTGSFARYTLAQSQPLPEMLEYLAGRLPPRLHRRIRHLLALWELPIPSRDVEGMQPPQPVF